MSQQPEIHDKIRAEVERRLGIAQAATPGPWSTSGPDTIAEWTIYDHQWSVATATAYDHDHPLSNRPDATGPGYIDPNANAAHIALHDPADSIRRYEYALKVLDRHRAKPIWNGGEIHRFYCDHCELGSWPCEDVADLATSLGIEVSS